MAAEVNEESKDDYDVSHHLEALNLGESNRERKAAIRMKIWSMMEEKDLLKEYPTSCFNRIPNFKQCGIAAEKLSRLKEFSRAKCIKINPSMAQMHLRYLTLQKRKILYVPSPALGDEFVLEIDPSKLTEKWHLKRASSKAGAKELGRAVSIDEKIKIDLFVVASVACSSNGVRLGKGLGYAEIEWGIFHTMMAVNHRTIVATTVHDSQVLDEKELPTSILSPHDLPVDIIVTPTRIINVRRKLPKPTQGILWDLITEEQLDAIPVLKELQRQQQEIQ